MQFGLGGHPPWVSTLVSGLMTSPLVGFHLWALPWRWSESGVLAFSIMQPVRVLDVRKMKRNKQNKVHTKAD